MYVCKNKNKKKIAEALLICTYIIIGKCLKGCN